MKPRNPICVPSSALVGAILLAGCLCIIGSEAAGAQKTESAASRPMSEEEAKKLRIEAGRDFALGNYSEALARYLKLSEQFSGDFEVNYRVGWLYLNGPAGDWQKALPYLRKAHRAKPTDVNALRDLAQASAWGRSTEAVPLYRELVRLAPGTLAYRLELARSLAWSGQTTEAIKQYTDYSNRAPSNLAARVELGQLLAQQRDFPGASEQFNYVLRFQNGNLAARLGLAQVLAWSGQMRPSLAELERVLKAKPDHFDALTLQAYDHLWLGEIDQANSTFMALAKRDPRNKDVQEGLKAVEQARAKGVATAAAPARPEGSPLLALAEKEEAGGDYAGAIAHYREHLLKQPNDDDAQFRLSRVLGWNKEYAESQSILRDWLTKHPDSVEGIMQLARVLSWDQKHQEAAEQYRKVLALKPQEVAAHIELAQVLAWTKQYTQALEEYRIALSLQPDNAEASAGYIQTLIWNGDVQAARRQFSELRGKFPGDVRLPPLQQQLETVEAQQAQAEAFAAGGQEGYFRGVVEKDPNDVQARLELADLYLSRRDFAAAIKEFRAASDLNPDDGIRLRLARALSWNQEYPESERLIRDFLTRHPEDQTVRLELARMLSWAKSYDASIAQYQEVIANDPDHLEARLELARVYSWSRQFEPSIGQYQELLKRNPGNTAARLELARVLTWSRRYDESLREYDGLLQQDPKNLDAWVGKGRAYSYQSRWTDARQAFDQALTLRPDDREALTSKAQVVLWAGDPAAARSSLAKLREENPGDTTVLISMASAENSLGRPDRALNLLEQAEKIEPKNTDITVLRQQIQAGLRPELHVGWSYVRDTEGLNSWRYQALDFRFNLHPRMRNFVTVDFLPTSAPADTFGYGVLTGNGTFFATQVPVEPFVPSPLLLTESDFPAQLLVAGNTRIRQSALQLQFGGSMRMNSWLSWTASVGAIELRYGSSNGAGFPATRNRVIFSASPTFQLSRHWQFSPGYARRYLAYTPKAISQTTHVEEISADLVWSPSDRTRVALGAYHRDLSPEFMLPTIILAGGGTFPGRAFRKRGNGGSFTATRTLWKGERSHFDLGYDAMVYGYTHPNGLPSPEFFLNAGVFTPSFYQRHAALVRVVLQPSKYLSWDLHGTAGVQQIHQRSDSTFSSTGGTRLDFPFSPDVTLSIGYDYFNTASALQALIVPTRGAAYHSNSVTARLSIRF